MTPQAKPNKPAAQSAKDSADISDEPKGLKGLLGSGAFKSVCLHGAILISLLVSFNFSAKPLQFMSPEINALAPQPEIVKATFIDSNVLEQKKREKAQSEAAARKKRADEKRRADKKKEDLRKKRDDDARKKREAQKEQEKRNLLEKEQQKERAIEKKREEEAKKKAEQLKRQQELDKLLTEQLEQEQAAMSQVNQRRVLTEVQKYEALVSSKVQQNLTTDGGFIGETCEVNIQLAPDGLVLTVKAVSGNPALCRIAEAAVLRAGTLPVSKDPEVMARFRKFQLEVSPKR